jgi:hypothetical protein
MAGEGLLSECPSVLPVRKGWVFGGCAVSGRLLGLLFSLVYTTVYTPRAKYRRNGVGSPCANGLPETKKARQSHDCQAFSSVGVTGFEPATTRPPGLKFNFAGKCNDLSYKGFIKYPVTCKFPLYGSISISRVPFVFHGAKLVLDP